MSSPQSLPVGSPDSVRAPASGGVVASRRCPICGQTPLTGRQEVCSGRCRAARSRQRKADARRERDAEIRVLLEAALKSLREDP
jgi:predicted nucleic acid-binding Zn ribbon protein